MKKTLALKTTRALPPKTFAAVALALLVALAAPAAARAQAADDSSPEAVVRAFYDWYLGSLNREDYHALRRRREALRYLTPQFHRRAPRIISEQMVDIFICAQDWQPEWGNDLAVSASPPRANRARARATFRYGGDAHTTVRLTLVRTGRAWRISGADCGE
ncbi:MAG TPA: hypothetical protein VN228_07870 [Pyrinomonadaceae bacterium]|nr:hypothetical protein [Pyrinomonadaceae bacterium]